MKAVKYVYVLSVHPSLLPVIYALMHRDRCYTRNGPDGSSLL